MDLTTSTPDGDTKAAVTVFRGWRHVPAHLQQCAVALGNFDGLHRGHRVVIETLVREAEHLRVPAVVVRFYPHPRQVLSHQPPAAMLRLREQVRLLREMGVQGLCFLRFTPHLQHMSPQTFMEEILLAGLQARLVVTGDDFRFGYQRAGHVAMLRAFLAPHAVLAYAVPQQHMDGMRFATSNIRQALIDGNMPEAERLLGRPFAMAGYVSHGDKRGRVLGMPTANIHLPQLQLPRKGVYAARVYGAGLQGGEAVVNIGQRPTVGGEAPRLEAHVLDASGDWYGQWLRVELKHFLRDEQRFDGLDALQQQMQQDKQQAATWLKAHAEADRQERQNA